MSSTTPNYIFCLFCWESTSHNCKACIYIYTCWWTKCIHQFSPNIVSDQLTHLLCWRKLLAQYLCVYWDLFRIIYNFHTHRFWVSSTQHIFEMKYVYSINNGNDCNLYHHINTHYAFKQVDILRVDSIVAVGSYKLALRA